MSAWWSAARPPRQDAPKCNGKHFPEKVGFSRLFFVFRPFYLIRPFCPYPDGFPLPGHLRPLCLHPAVFLLSGHLPLSGRFTLIQPAFPLPGRFTLVRSICLQPTEFPYSAVLPLSGRFTFIRPTSLIRPFCLYPDGFSFVRQTLNWPTYPCFSFFLPRPDLF